MTKIRKTVLIISFYAIVLSSINLYCSVKISNTLIYYTASFFAISLSMYECFHKGHYKEYTYIALIVYLLWTFFGIIRGIFEVNSYWVFNQLVHGILNTLPPIIIFLFSSPYTFLSVFRHINVFIFVLSFLLFGWCLSPHAYAFLLVPFYFLYSCFMSKIPGKWFWYVLLVVILIGSQLENRSGVIKVLASIGILLLFHLPKLLQNIGIHVAHFSFYVLALLFLWLGVTGRYNVFNSSYFDTPDNTVVYSAEISSSNQEKSRLSIDTRTFLYVETISSAIDLDYFWIGRTPAHGYITEYFAEEGPVEAGRDPSERFFSEVALLNTFTWLGVIGVILLSLVFIEGTCLAIYASNNKYVKCIAIWVAFQWLYSWIENGNQFQMLDLMIYANLAICYSPHFRRMNDNNFLLFFKSLFGNPKDKSLFEKKQIFLFLLLKKKLETVSSR